MNLSPKLEVLGQISERARQLEAEELATDAEFVTALFDFNLTRTAQASSWPERREALVELLAAGLNWILDRDRVAAAAIEPSTGGDRDG